MSNPLRELMKKSEKKTYPITVKCVVDDISIINNDIHTIREFSHSLNIMFVTREYNSIKYSDDRDRIRRLPAFHIYVKKSYKKTFYIDTEPCDIIQQTVEKYLKKLEESEKNKLMNLFIRTIESIKSFMNRNNKIEFKKKIYEWS
jgi:hypothetical protein